MAANTGVKANATGRGAVQFTDLSNDHCIGKRTSSLKRLFARRDMTTNTQIAKAAINACNIQLSSLTQWVTESAE